MHRDPKSDPFYRVHGSALFCRYLLTCVGGPDIYQRLTNIWHNSRGTAVIITGSGFTNATAVTFGGAAATSFTVVSDTSITATTPAGAAGSANIIITAPAGTATGTYTYTASAPTFTSIFTDIRYNSRGHRGDHHRDRLHRGDRSNLWQHRATKSHCCQ